jgi:transposase
MSITEAARVFKLPRQTVSSIVKNYEETGRKQAAHQGGNRRSILDAPKKEIICDWVDEDCTVSLASLAIRASVEFGLPISRKTVERCLKEFHYTVKRTKLVPERRNSPDVIVDRKR